MVAGAVEDEDCTGAPVRIFGIELARQPVQEYAEGPPIRIGLTGGEIGLAECVDAGED